MKWWMLSLGLGVALAQAPLKVEDAWVRLSPTRLSGAFMTLSNPSSKPVKVVGVQSPAAARAEIHQTVTLNNSQGEATGMRPVAALVIPAGGKVELGPGGYHIMLIGLKQPLKEGQKLKLTLKLGDGQLLSVEATVMAR